NAIRYTYPKKNLLALKSITIDKTEEEKIYIFEFDKSSKYITKESIESILKIMKETPNNYRGNIIAESDEEIIQKEIKSYNTTKTTILVLEFEPDVDCNHINIWRGNRKFDIQIEQNGVKINVLEFYSSFNEKEGTMHYSQSYNSIEKKWEKIEKQFLEDYGVTTN
ncbi:MAG: hypothetical protein K5858_08400, partial [Lachnospiraceae bacterium]|nr:hypothetical protein [Lachnospiraceae bacterium]